MDESEAAAGGNTTTPPPNTTAVDPKTTSVPPTLVDTPPLTATTAVGAGRPDDATSTPTVLDEVVSSTTELPTIVDTPSTVVVPDPALIMPLGDSITEKPEYRLAFTQRLIDEGCLFEMLGSMEDAGFVSIGPWLDPNHEGHAGLRADEIADNAAAWASAAKPEFVLLYAGINDLYAGQDVPSTIDDLRRTIGNLRSANKNVTVLVAQILPGVGVEGEVASLNQAIAAMQRQLDVAESRVVLVDHASGIDLTADTWDGVHPNQSGGQKMSDRWYAALRPLIEVQCSF